MKLRLGINKLTLLFIFSLTQFAGYVSAKSGILNFTSDPLITDSVSPTLKEKHHDFNVLSFQGISDQKLVFYIDSLFSLDDVPLEFVNRINLYLSLKNKDEAELSSMLDSLKKLDQVPEDFINQINLFLSVKGKSDEAIYSKIDSLLKLDEVPFQIINQINYYVATRTNTNESFDLNKIAVTNFYDQSLYPANCFYESWDTKKTQPYSDDLWAADSIQKLVVEDSANFCKYVHPYNGPLTSPFGPRDGRNHNGIDIDLKTGAPVVAAFDGMVRVARNQSTYGNVVVIRHYNGLETLYAHLYKIKVKPGQVINAGQVLGLGGNTGRSRGSHLHFEIRFKGKPIDPSYLISFEEKELFSDAFILKKTKSSYIAFPEGAAFHKVKKGDLPYQIAERYGISLKKLQELNTLNKKSRLMVGQELRIN